MTEQEYRHACDLAEAAIEALALPEPDWQLVHRCASELAAIAYLANEDAIPDA